MAGGELSSVMVEAGEEEEEVWLIEIVCLSLCLFVYTTVFLLCSLFICLSLCLFVCVAASVLGAFPICLSECLFVCLPAILPSCLIVHL